jgi:methanogenic corrinoid protein MtbC1
MSLLIQSFDDEVKELAQKIYNTQFQRDPKLGEEYDQRQKRLMYEDILYNLGYLFTAMKFDDKRIFAEYAAWIYTLLYYLMQNIDKKRIAQHMTDHYEILTEELLEYLPPEMGRQAEDIIKTAIEITNKYVDEMSGDKTYRSAKYMDIKNEYMGHLLANNTRGAMEVIQKVKESGIPLEDIYIHILQDVMVEVGDMWHRNVISVDKEHYFTAVTQMVLSQFYSEIFGNPRIGKRVLSCCVGSELHEMGIRMVSDLFELHGWESVYLGAAVPKDSLLKAISEHSPDLVALSVTIPIHLDLCYELVMEIREKYPLVKIAVGGRAFQTTNKLWEKWKVDVYTENADQLIQWADEHMLGSKPSQ